MHSFSELISIAKNNPLSLSYTQWERARGDRIRAGQHHFLEFPFLARWDFSFTCLSPTTDLQSRQRSSPVLHWTPPVGWYGKHRWISIASIRLTIDVTERFQLDSNPSVASNFIVLVLSWMHFSMIRWFFTVSESIDYLLYYFTIILLSYLYVTTLVIWDNFDFFLVCNFTLY